MGKPMDDEGKMQEGDLETESRAEVEAGFQSGPYSEAEVSHKLGTTDWGLTTRFALYQGEGKKIRIIDNYRDSAVNSAFAATSYIALQDTDFVVGLLRFFMQIARHQEEVVVELSNGRVLRGKWRCSMKKRPKLLGRCVDLSKAYKQVAIDCQSLVHGVLGYQTVQHGWRLYTTQSLPFGASASLFAFNKISRALWHLLHKLGIITSVFYDDFPCFEVEPLTEHTTKILNGFFDVLGWRNAVTGKKATDFAAEMQALAVQYNLEHLWDGRLEVQNKPSRIDRIRSLNGEFREAGKTAKGGILFRLRWISFAVWSVRGGNHREAWQVVARMDLEGGCIKARCSDGSLLSFWDGWVSWRVSPTNMDESSPFAFVLVVS